MIKRERKDLDIFQIGNSGQCFRMDKLNETSVALIAGDRYLEVTQELDSCIFSCTEQEFEDIWSHYFDFETDYSYFKGKIDVEDSYMINAARCGSGIRILNQDLFETIISFIISQQNNIKRIKKCINIIAEKYGEVKYNLNNKPYFSFPLPEKLAVLEEEELRKCGLGYRSRYIIETARDIAEGKVNLDKIKTLPYEKSKQELMSLTGVGNKVADCICLFALHHIDAFPIDTHIKAVLEKHYKNGFPLEMYKGFAGVLQQYAFYYEINISNSRI